MKALAAAGTIALCLLAGSALARPAAASCEPTTPNGHTPPGAPAGPSNHGAGELTALLWLGGEVDDTRAVHADGSIRLKLGWWRGRSGDLLLEARRVDAAAPEAVTNSIADGYPPTGFLPTSIVFPTSGCWLVTGRLGEDEVSFVVRLAVGRESWRPPVAQQLEPRPSGAAVQLRWRGEGATFDVQLRRGSSPWRLVRGDTASRTLRIAPRLCGVYSARVRARDLFGVGPWSGARRFAVTSRATGCR